MWAIVEVLFALLATFVTSAQADSGRTEEITIEATIDREGDFMAYGFDALWIVSHRHLSRINPADNSVTDFTIDKGIGSNRGIAIGEDAVWIPDTSVGFIFKFDPHSNAVKLTIPAPMADSEGSIGAGFGAVWAVTSENDNKTLMRFNAQTGAEEAAIALPSTSIGVVTALGSVWVTGMAGNEVYRIDPAKNRITAVIAVHGSPRFMSASEDAVWVLNQKDGTVQRIDGKSGKLIATVETEAIGAGGDIAVGGGSIWVTSHRIPVIQIDPATNAVRGNFKRPSGVYTGDAIRYGAGSVWVSGSAVFRIKPPQ